MPYKYGTGIYPNSIKPLLSSQPPHTLHPITPNPAKDLITIRFDLKNATNLSLKVISIDGRQVYDIANAFLQAGPHTYRWDATGVKAGNYILWMGTNEIQYRQQFIVK